MKTVILTERGRISLVVDAPGSPAERPDVLAAMTVFEGTNCWHLLDVRLAQFRAVSPYACSGSAEDYHAIWEPESLEEADFVKSQLREYREDENGSIHWCSFEGIVRGHPEINGYHPPQWAGFEQAGYVSRKEGLARIKEIQKFWDVYEGDPAKAKIDNPNRQPTQSEVMSNVLLWRRGILLPTDDANEPSRKKPSSASPGL